MAGRKNKNGITLFILLIAMIALIGAYFLLTRYNQNKSETSATEDKEVTLAKLDTDLIKSIYFSNQNSTMTLIRNSDNQWEYEQDSLFPVNQESANAMEISFANLDATMTVAEDATNLEEFGLKEPSIQVVVTLDDGTSTSVALGKEAPIADGYYATVNGKSTVYIVPSSFYEYFNKSINDMMTMEEIPQMSTDVMTHLLVNNKKNGNLELNYDKNTYDYTGNSNWKILKPYGNPVPADTQAVTTLLNNYTAMTFDSVAGYNVTDLSQYGLDHPAASVTIDYYADTAKAAAESKETSDAAGAGTSTASAGSTAANTGTTAASVETTAETTGSSAASTEAQSDSTEAGKAKATREYYTYELLFGKTDSDGNYYVKSKDSNMVYLMSSSKVEKLINVTPYKLVSTGFSLINVDTVDQVVLNTGTDTYNLSIKRTTEKVKNKDTGNEEESITKEYSVNGNTIKEDAFLKLYNTITAPVTEREIPSGKTGDSSKKPVLTIVFHRNTDTDQKITIKYLPYDDSFYRINVNGSQYFLADKRVVDEIAESLSQYK